MRHEKAEYGTLGNLVVNREDVLCFTVALHRRVDVADGPCGNAVSGGKHDRVRRRVAFPFHEERNRTVAEIIEPFAVIEQHSSYTILPFFAKQTGVEHPSFMVIVFISISLDMNIPYDPKLLSKSVA